MSHATPSRRRAKATELQRGHRVAGRYRIEAVIGEGAQGTVYEATREPEGVSVALKVIHRHLCGSDQVQKRFQREAMILKRLDGEHLVKLLDFFEEDKLLMIALEYVEGTSLEARLKEKSPLDIKEAVEIALQVCAALGSAHAAGIVHRDLKPANVLLEHPAPEPVSAPSSRIGGSGGLTPVPARPSVPDALSKTMPMPAVSLAAISTPTDVRVRVVDFGVAKAIHGGQMAGPTTNLTEQGMIFGTAEYMSPEQARGDEADARSDLYAAGVILYEMAVGKVPFHGPSQIAVMTAHLRSAPPPPRAARPGGGITASIEAVILRALAKNPADRYPSARAFAEAIASARDEQRLIANPPRSGATVGDPQELANSDTDLHLVAPSLGMAKTMPTQVVPEALKEELRKAGSAAAGTAVAKTLPERPASEPDRPITLSMSHPVRAPANRGRWIWAAVAILAAVIGVVIGTIIGVR
jgi:eukaryotic-like serine/threonine-protein kinase